jgi:hypothetical protein
MMGAVGETEFYILGSIVVLFVAWRAFLAVVKFFMALDRDDLERRRRHREKMEALDLDDLSGYLALIEQEARG